MAPRQSFRFGQFELDVDGYQLRRNGRPIRLERQPMDLLILLVERRHQLVPRADIIARLWNKDVFVDVETGVNTAIRKARQALDDSLKAPAFIETVSGKGYRFIADVDVVHAARGVPVVMLAVLPFRNLSGDPERDYLADGLTEDTIASVGQIDPERLHVIGRTSAMSYKNTRKSLATVGDELRVEYVIEGSLRSEGSLLRIQCTLNRVRDQVQMWSTSYDRELTSILGVQRELSAAIAVQIRLRLTPERVDAVSRRHTRKMAAYDLYLRGRRFWNQLTPATTRVAIDYYSRATEIDRDYGLAWAGLADAYASAPLNGDASPLEMWPRAREAAEHAIRSDPDLADAQHAMGLVNWLFEWNFSAAEAALRQAVALDPSNAWAQSMFGHVLSQIGRHEEARIVTRRSCLLEPLSALHHAMRSQVAFQAGDMYEAADCARRAIVVEPELWVGYMMRGQAFEQLGETDVAFEQLATASRLSGGNSKPISLVGYMRARLGQLEDAREILTTLQEVSCNRYVPPYAMALIYAGLDDQQMLFEWLERAYTVRDVHLMFLAVDPKWDSFRSDPRFNALLERCGFTSAANASSV